ncbi:hypothetical protein Z043_101058, partial [Scleropages formosus]
VLCTVNRQRSTIFPHSAGVLRSLRTPPCARETQLRVCAFSDVHPTALPGQVSRTPPIHPVDDQDSQAVDASKQFCDSVGSPVDLLSLVEHRMPLEDMDGAPALSPFEEISEEEAIQIQAQPAMPPVSISLKDYVEQSETLQQLLLLGVDLWKLEQRPNVGSMLLRLDFQMDVKERLLFLKDVGVEDSQLGSLITRNPFILTEGLENLKARVEYLKSKKFNQQAVASMVSRAPYLLNFSIERLDNRLSFYQQTLGLSAEKILNSKLLRIKERHLFLQYLGRAQYDPNQPNYVSLNRLVSLPDNVFCSDVALASLEDFELFQKTL